MSQIAPQSYDDEYASCSTFWPLSPGKYVQILAKELIPDGPILDLGAGLGGNSIFLARQGKTVVAVERSAHAIRAFRENMRALPEDVQARIAIVEEDVIHYRAQQPFSAVIAYGLLHCLKDISAIRDVIEHMQECTEPRGMNVVVAITNRLPVPEVQAYLHPLVISEAFLREAYSEWSLVSFEHSVLTESHPTNKIEHQHSICRLIARNVSPRS